MLTHLDSASCRGGWGSVSHGIARSHCHALGFPNELRSLQALSPARGHPAGLWDFVTGCPGPLPYASATLGPCSFLSWSAFGQAALPPCSPSPSRPGQLSLNSQNPLKAPFSRLLESFPDPLQPGSGSPSMSPQPSRGTCHILPSLSTCRIH